MKNTISVLTMFLTFLTAFAQETSPMDCMKQFTGTWEGATDHEYFEGANLEKMKFVMTPDLGGSVIHFQSYFKMKDQDWQKNATGFLLEEKDTGKVIMNAAWKVGRNQYIMNGHYTCENNKATAEIDVTNGTSPIKQKGSWTLALKNEFINSFTDYIEGREPRPGQVIFKKQM